jgi:putative acetyltransferase
VAGSWVAEFGATSVVLETGDRQIAALGLYESSGYFRIPCFGAYAVSPSSVCLQKRLGPVAARPAR